MDCLFESVQAVLREDLSQFLKKDTFLKLNSFIDGYKETLGIFKSENGCTAIIGSLKAVILCQQFLVSHLKKVEIMNDKYNLNKDKSQESYLGNDILKADRISHSKVDIAFPSENLCPLGRENFKLDEKLKINMQISDFDNRTSRSNCVSDTQNIPELNDHHFSNDSTLLYTSTRSNIAVTTSMIDIAFKYSCELCPFKSLKEKLFLKHLKYHRKRDDSLAHFSCSSCCESYILACEYEEHMKSRHRRKDNFAQASKNVDEEITTITCQICRFEARHTREYKKHMDTVHPTTYSCSRCSYSTKRKVHYIRHVSSVHENVRPLSCQICGATFKRQDTLRQHEFIHSRESKTEARFQCEVCSKVFRSANYLREHKLTHSNVRSFLCEMCGASFKTRSVHRNHMKVVHSDTLQAGCKICGKTFSTKYSLKRHFAQHESRNSEEWVTEGHVEKSTSSNVDAEPSQNKHVDLIASAWANASCVDNTIMDTVYTGIPPESFNASVENQIPYIVHSTRVILSE